MVASVLLSGTTLMAFPQQAQAATVRDFEPLFKAQVNGANLITGNTLLSCDQGKSGCGNVQNGSDTSNGASNNSWTMQLVDTDSDADTKSSSSAGVTLPAGARVLYAGLFWGAARSAGNGGSGTTSDGTTMKLRVPGAAAYTAVTSSQTDYLSGSNRDYSSYVDVTEQVRSAGSGTYWGADVPTGTGGDRYAGWSLVISYQDPTAPLRDLTVFGGYARITGSDVNQTTLSGFLAPPAGAVNARFGMVVYEGDVGITGDYFAVNGTRLADTLSPSANFFSSRITAGGVNLTDRDPAHVNNLGPDAKVVDAPGVIPNGATSAEVTFATRGDAYYPAALTTSIDLYAPTIHGDKTVTNLSGNNPAKVGDTLEYTLTYSNTGDDDALGSVVRDVLPQNTTYLPGSLRVIAGANAGAKTDSAGDDQAEYVGGSRTVRFRVGTGANVTNGGRLTTNASTTVRFRVTVDQAAAGTAIVNTGFLDYRGETLNKPFSYETPPVSTPVAESADVSITKTASPEPVAAGQNFTYTLTIGNTGPSAARDVEVTDTLPDGVELVSAEGCTRSGQTLSCALGELAVNSTKTLTVVVRVPATTAAGGITNVASVTTSTSDPNLDNNNDSVGSTIKRSADLRLTKSVSAESPLPGQSVGYQLIVINDGPSTADAVRISDSLPAALTIGTATATSGSCEVAGNDITCTAGSLAPGASITVTVTATLDAGYTGGPLTNTAQAVSETPDPNDANNKDTATVTPAAPAADLSVKKETLTDPVVAGRPISYRITVRNDGPSDARNVTISDDTPATLTGVGAEPGQGSCTVTDGAVSCALGMLTAGSTATVFVTATVSETATGTLANSATVTSPTNDPDPDDNTGKTTDPITASADLAVTKTASPVPVIAGRPVTYTLKVTNSGPSAAREVVVTDPVPAPLTYASSSVSQGTCAFDDGTVRCAVGTVGVGVTVTVTVVANVPSGAPPSGIDNTATVASPTPDPVESNNTATYTLLTGAQANITLSKTVDPDPVLAGEQVTWTLTVSNAGPSGAQGVQVTDTVPSAVTGVTATATNGATCDVSDQVVTCDRATLAAGASFVVTVTGTVARSTELGPIVNAATATSRTPEDPTDSDNTAKTPTTVTTAADLSVGKDAPATVVAGNEITYRLTVRNAGPSDAVDTAVADSLPDGVTFVSGSGPGGACTQAPGASEPVVRCPVGRLVPGGSQVITISGKVDPGQPAGTITNTATASSRTPDPNDGNDTGTADTRVVTSADVSITKSVEPSPVVAGAEAQYTLTIKNSGPSTARQVAVTDTLPAGLTAIDAITPEGSCTVNGQVVTCGLGSLSPEATATVLIRVAVPAAQTGAVTNTATVTSETPDPDPGGDTSTIVTKVDQAADLEVVKTADPSPAVAGSGLTYLLTIVNHGPSTATGTGLTDVLPAGLTVLTMEPSQGGCTLNEQTVGCDLGTLEPGASATVRITGTLAGTSTGTSLTNTATVGSEVDDPKPENDSSTVTVPVVTSADLVVRKYAEPQQLVPGRPFDYAITVANEGPSVARSVVVTDAVPDGVTVVSATWGTNECEISGPNVRCELGDLPLGQAAIDLSVRLDAGYDATTVKNTARATSSTPDPTPDNNTSTVTSPVVPQADLGITKAMAPANPVAGGEVTYTLKVQNFGPSNARDVIVTDELPRAVTALRVSATGMTCVVEDTPGRGPDDPRTEQVTCRAGTFTLDETGTVQVVGRIDTGFRGALENAARVGADTLDPVVDNNEDTVTGTVTAPPTPPTTPPPTTPPPTTPPPTTPSVPTPTVPTPTPTVPPTPPGGDLGDTGGPFGWGLLLAAGIAAAGGAVLLIAARRKPPA
ncbi:DUF7507 domain-containing protein [Kribbella catacumbae]|uniref:DUF7507 domain-containing protein n=1 Tax=Kribbella catacumbae TaxID=460086 RepID=UPI001ED9C11E|nr:hypothetical protein [Kribbella catacumbae]